MNVKVSLAAKRLNCGDFEAVFGVGLSLASLTFCLITAVISEIVS